MRSHDYYKLYNFILFLPERKKVPQSDLFLFVSSCMTKPTKSFESCSEKTGLRGFRPGPTQNGLHSHTRWLEA